MEDIMGLRREYDDEDQSFSNSFHEEEVSPEQLHRKKHVKKLLEDRLERKRLKEEFDELDGEFDWDDFDR